MPRLNIQGCIFLKKEGDSQAMTDDITISTTGFSRIVHRDTTALDDKLHKPTKIQPKGNNININGKKGVKVETTGSHSDPIMSAFPILYIKA